MAQGKFDIYVYANWIGLNGPVEIGVLSAHFAKAKKAFSFAYKKEWLEKGLYPLLDPDSPYYTLFKASIH